MHRIVWDGTCKPFGWSVADEVIRSNLRFVCLRELPQVRQCIVLGGAKDGVRCQVGGTSFVTPLVFGLVLMAATNCRRPDGNVFRLLEPPQTAQQDLTVEVEFRWRKDFPVSMPSTEATPKG